MARFQLSPTTMTRAERIETTLADGIVLEHIEVIDESGNHSVPDGAESHFKVVAVSEEFIEKTRIARHRAAHHAHNRHEEMPAARRVALPSRSQGCSPRQSLQSR